jgi:hypothetical protein
MKIDYIYFGGTYCLHLQDQKVSQASNLLVIYLAGTLKIEAVRSSEIPVNFYRTTLHEDIRMEKKA